MDEYAIEELQDARDALSDAHKLRESGGTDKAIINRLYYACFHAVRAVLHTRGFDPTTHQGAIRVFGREIVENGDATRDDGRFFNDLRRDRQTADYEHDPVEAEICEVFERTEAFVADMEALV